MTDTERAEYRQALRAMQERTQALDDLLNRCATDLAMVRVVIDHSAEQDHQHDELVAHAYGGPRPKLTAGAQAILAIDAQERRQ